MEDHKAAIVYFSKDGNTRLGARILNERVDGTIIELKESRAGNALQAYFKRGSQLVGEPWKKIEAADQVYVMFPIWADNGVPAMNTFIEQADFTGKTVVIITFQQRKSLRKSAEVHAYVSAMITKNGGTVKGCYACLGGMMGHCLSDAEVRPQIAKVKILTTDQQ